MKIASIHQPHFLPWLGYFNKIAQSDVFVILDTVQFRKNYFQNRTELKNLNGEPFWLTIPVLKSSLGTPITEIKLLNNYLLKKTIKQIEGLYLKSTYFKIYFPELESILDNPYSNLSRLNYDLLFWAIKVLGITTKIQLASNMNIDNVNDPNLRLIEILAEIQATHYIAGKGGKNYMNETLFKENNFEILWQDFNATNIIYPQINGNFLPNISFLDALFNIGSEKTSDIVKNTWKPF
jgi:hypothetical protein